MSHAIYQTPALILKTKNMREANKLIILYTREFGLLFVSSQSIRVLSSKMRFHTSSLSLVDVDLVEGRDIWKLTGIHENISALTLAGTSWYDLSSNIARVIMRLCKGEESNLALWEDIQSLYSYMTDYPEPSAKDRKILEIIIVVRILYHLGYWQGDDEITQTGNFFDTSIHTYVETHRKKLISGIHDAFEESQL